MKQNEAIFKEVRETVESVKEVTGKVSTKVRNLLWID